MDRYEDHVYDIYDQWVEEEEEEEDDENGGEGGGRGDIHSFMAKLGHASEPALLQALQEHNLLAEKKVKNVKKKRTNRGVLYFDEGAEEEMNDPLQHFEQVFACHWCLLQQKIERKYRALMNSDRNRDGGIDLYRTRGILRECGLSLSLRQVTTFLNRFDQEEDPLTLEAFTNRILRGNGGGGGGGGGGEEEEEAFRREVDTPMYKLFQVWDTNNTGSLTLKKLWAWSVWIRALNIPNCRVYVKFCVGRTCRWWFSFVFDYQYEDDQD